MGQQLRRYWQPQIFPFVSLLHFSLMHIQHDFALGQILGMHGQAAVFGYAHGFTSFNWIIRGRNIIRAIHVLHDDGSMGRGLKQYHPH